MKTIFTFLAIAVCLASPTNPCFALWEIEIVSKGRAKELGMRIQSTAVGPKHFRLELEFKPEGPMKHFTQVDLSVRNGDNLEVAAALREDRSKPGRVAVNFTAALSQLDKFTLRVMVPYRDGGAGGVVYEIPVKDFVEVKKAPEALQRK